MGELFHHHYRILESLGGGAMGEVFLVESLERGQREALKILRPRSEEKGFAPRFRREARALARLDHPNIVSLYDFGRLADGRWFLTMEYAEGQVLGDILDAAGELEPERVLRLLAQLGEAIGHAQARGVIHRDLKPENIIVGGAPGAPEQLKITDFGVAKITAADYEDTYATSADLFCGTPYYMPPEQFRQGARGDDPRIDIYAAGCVAYELLVGAPPFLGRSPLEVFQGHLKKAPVPPSEAAPAADVPPELDEVILRCMEKDPARRFQTGGELRRAVERVSRPGARPPCALSLRLERQDDDLEETVIQTQLPSSPPEGDRELGRPALRPLLCDLADRLVASGRESGRLALALTWIRELEAALEHQGAEEEALREQRRALERRAGVAGALAELDEREISLAVRRADREDELAELYAEIHQLVRELAPLQLHDPGIRELVGRLGEAGRRNTPTRRIVASAEAPTLSLG